MNAGFIAVDWGTTRLRAFLIGADGKVLASQTRDSGVQSVLAGQFPDALRACCAEWLAQYPAIPLVMAGMVGSRNGWVEVPYATTPCGVAELAAACHAMELDGHKILLAPGVDTRWPATGEDRGAYDVMRGEETQVLGLGLRDGLVCLPGTHCKWVRIEDGRIAAFATFITGELYAAMSGSFIGRLAEEPPQVHPAAAIAAVAAHLRGGLSRALFQARSRVLAGDIGGSGVKPYLSALLVEDEISGALDLFSGFSRVHLVAGEPQLSAYATALAARGLMTQVVDPQIAFLAGLARLLQWSGHSDNARK